MSGSSAGALSSPLMSPLSRHVRSGSAGAATFRRHTAAREAAQRLARVMAHQHVGGESSEDDDPSLAPHIELSTPRRANRSPSPATSIDRPTMPLKTTPIIPSIKPSTKPVLTSLPSESPVTRREKRMSLDLGNFNMTEPVKSHSYSTLQDEIYVLQEENENLLEKLRLTEERFEEAEARVKQLEKQVTSLGEGVSLEARLLSRKEAALQKREAAMRATTVQRSVSKEEEIASLQMEAKSAKDNLTSVAESLLEAESEIKFLRTATLKMILNVEEMEEVVLKRCWLARYWKLCVQHGIHLDIAEAKNEYWSSFAPLPEDVVMSASQKAIEASSSGKADQDNDRLTVGIIDLLEEENIESMLLVEKGLRELVSLKVEEAVLLSMAKRRCTNNKDPMFSLDGSNPAEAFELSLEELEDVRFKQAWLIYIWKRVNNHGLEEDIAEDRLKYWIEKSAQHPDSQDAFEVERGLLELKKLGIESQLWEACHRGINEGFSHAGS